MKVIRTTISLLRTKKILLTNIVVLIILLPLAYLSLNYAKSTKAAWHDDNYLYRKQLTFGNSGATISSTRKVKFDIDTAALISANKIQSDCDDVRFVSSTGKVLKNFIDTDEGACNTSSTDYYVEFSSIPTGTNIVYMYYGNPTASSNRSSEFFAPSTSSTLGNKLKGYWTLDETSGVRYDNAHGNSLTDNNTVTSTTGKVSTAAQFTSANSESLTRADNAELSAGDVDFAMSAWVYLDDKSDIRPIVAKDDGSGAREYLLSYDNSADAFAFEVFDGSSSIAQVQATTLGSPSTSTWYFITAWHDSGTDTINISVNNGATDSNSTSGMAPGDSGENFSIGKSRETVYHMNGRVDNVFFWKRLLTAGEITALYNSGSGLSFGDITFSPTTGPTLLTEETTPGPVLYWKFDEGYGTTSQDSTLNNNDGTTSGVTITNDGECVAGKCLSFDGVNDKVTKTYSSDTELAPGTGSFTLSGWFKHPSTQSGTDTIFARADGLNGVGYKAYMNSSGFICFGIDDTVGSFPSESACSTTTYADSAWHNFSAVKSGTSSITLYIDGSQIAQDASLTTTSSLSGSSSGIYVGIDADGTSNPWTGFIDDIKIYPFARSAAQVKTDANFAGTSKGTSAILGASNQERLSEGLVGYWKMDEASGSRADSSSNGNTLTDNNTVTANPGKFGNGGQFTSANSESLSITNNASIAVGDEDFTVAGWVYLDTKAASQVFARKLGTGGWLFDYHSGVDSFQFVTYDSGGGVAGNAFGGISPSTSTWYYIVGWQDSKNKVVGFTVNDGTPVTATYTGSMGTNTSDFIVGGNSAYWNGRIDEVRMYKRLLSPAERARLYSYAPGPIAYWNLDEKTGTTASDISGGNNSGTLTGNPTWTRGKFGSSVSFDGDDYTAISTVTGTLASTSTVSYWVKTTQTSTSSNFWESPGILGVESGGTDDIRWGWIDTVGKIHFDVANDYPTNYAVSTNAVNDGLWHHICMTRDATTGVIVIYIDGVLNKSATGTTGVATSLAISQIGAINGSYNPYSDYIGSLDEIRIYNYVRSQKQIVEDMNGDHPLGGSPVGSQVGYWKLDEGNGTSANDTSVNSNTLTLSTATSAWTNAGKFGKAWDGNGSRYISRADDADFDVAATDDYAVSLWYKSDSASNPGATEYILNKANATTAGYAIYANTSGQICFGIDDDTTWNPDIASCSTVDYYDATWHQITAQRDASGTDKTYLYIDGKLQDSDSDTTTATLANSLSLYIGDRDGTDNGDEFTGDIDEVKIYRGILSQSEILADYTRGSSLVMGALSDNSSYDRQAANQEYCVPGDTTSCASPVGEWKLDEKTGTTANDTSGNANTGTITAGTGGWKAGKIGSAYNFDAANSVINAGSGSTLDNLPSAGMTVESWIYPKSAGENSLGFIAAKNVGTTPSAGWILRLNSTTSLTFTVDGSTDLVSTTNTSLITQNAWNHVVVSWDGVITTATSVHIYINGKEATYATQTNGASRVDDASSTLYLGNDSTSARTFDGYIDHVRIFNYSRTFPQVAWDYNRGAPVTYYKFDECSGSTANDSSLNINNGTITIGATGSQTSAGSCVSGTSTEAWNNGNSGKYSGSLKFDGTDDYVTTADANSLDQTGNLTISMWVNPTALTNNEAELMQKGTADDCQNYGLALYGGTQLTLLSSNSCSWSYAGSHAILTTGSWQYVTATYDGTNVRYYINGTLKDTLAWGGIGAANSGALVIGGGPSQAASDYFNGLIDDVRIYNYALTGAQIKTVMNEGSAVRFGPSSGQP